MEAETNQVTLLYRDGRVERLPEMPKARVAAAIIRRLLWERPSGRDLR
jgi:phosphopantothenoylcysteine synthetase/decarboxylase